MKKKTKKAKGTLLINCARCGGTHTIVWRPLPNPPEIAPGAPRYTHWAPCPRRKGAPILCLIVEDPEPA